MILWPTRDFRKSCANFKKLVFCEYLSGLVKKRIHCLDRFTREGSNEPWGAAATVSTDWAVLRHQGDSLLGTLQLTGWGGYRRGGRRILFCAHLTAAWGARINASG